MAERIQSTVVIPAYNNAALTRQCLDAVLRTSRCQVIVVDDASTDDTAAVLAGFGKQIRVITHKTNRGFARTCNAGAKATRTKFVVFLNNDTIPQPGWLRALENYAKKHPRAAAIGSRLVYPDNTIQHAGVVICQDRYPRHIYTGFPADHPAVNQSRRFQIVTAASMLVRRNVFTAARGFDTKFQNGFEDVDFCLRLGKLGHEVHYCAGSLVQHFESVSPGRFKRDKDNIALYRKRWLGSVQPDDLSFFIVDGLLAVTYEGAFPLHLKISPELAVLQGERSDATEKLLGERGRQLAGLTREVTRLRVALGEKNPASAVLLQDRDRDQVRGQVRLATPPDAKILVVSKGDNALLDLDGRNAQHFPQTANGVYQGYHPADSAEAITQLDKLRAKGAEYLLFPAPSFWWLEHYAGFTRHLEKTGSLVQRDSACVIYSLRRLRLRRPKKPARVIALLATHNEERFIKGCLENLIAQGAQVHLLDNDSTDRTVAIAREFLGRGLLAIEKLPRAGIFSMRDQLARKEQLAQTLDADWFMHVDADEIHRSPVAGMTLAQAFAAVEVAGYNSVNFQEFTFIPTAESPDHDHADYERTMRWYYPFLPRCPWGVRAWRRQPGVALAASGGHQLQFEGMKLCPRFFSMKHYQFLSVAQALRKYVRTYAEPELRDGMHGGHQGWRNQFRSEGFALPPQAELREFKGNGRLDATHPWLLHFLEKARPSRAGQIIP